jgi:hypothetical protein
VSSWVPVPNASAACPAAAGAALLVFCRVFPHPPPCLVLDADAEDVTKLAAGLLELGAVDFFLVDSVLQLSNQSLISCLVQREGESSLSLKLCLICSHFVLSPNPRDMRLPAFLLGPRQISQQ